MPCDRRVILVIGVVCAMQGGAASWSRAGQPPSDASRPASVAPAVDFARDILTVFQRSCWECHGERRQEGGLRLDSAEAALSQGDAIVPGKPDASELIRRIRLPRGHDEIMPNRGEPLRADDIRRIEAWIASGARWPADARPVPHWSYVKPVRPTVPTVRETGWIAHNAIDTFIQQRLIRESGAGAKFAPSPEASRPVLLRRLSFDLIGVPPTPDEVSAFVADDDPAAYERQVDRLLASEQFGVRWARPWLDYARYADSHGFQRDDLRDLWAYRDWVVDALNADMPFPQFTLEQLAGDLLPDATLSQKIATGFNRSAPTNVEAGSDPEETRVNQVFDRVNTIGMIWLGTTLECAQCHDHKYDPFTQRDYYGLFAVFNNTALEADRTNPKVPGSIQFRGPTMKISDSVSTLIMQENTPRNTTILQRGDFRSPGESITPSLPALFQNNAPSANSPPAIALSPANAAQGQRSGSPSPVADTVTRVELARWLASSSNPLVARVTVNRWWSELFGRALVTTPEDFGIKGERPTHPELLDWLACEFMDSGWSMKTIIKTMVMSATYRQSSRLSAEWAARDDANSLYARGPRHRLEAEMIRDNALAIAGLLSSKRGGPPIRPYQPDGLWIKVGGQRYDYEVSPGGQKHRRGLYVVWKRAAPYPSFVNFDANSRMACRVKRPRSNTPLQALTLMNDPVYVEAAFAFASRVLTDRPQAGDAERIEYAFRLAVARAPSEAESRTLLRLLAEERQSRATDVASSERFLAERTRPAGVDAVELAAWYAVAATLLNIDETITKG